MRFNKGAKVWYYVGVNSPRASVLGTVQSVDSRSNFARAYGKQIKMTNGATVNVCDVQSVESHFRHYFCEVTDTFGGEANYSWVRRYKVRTSSARGAILKVAREQGFSGRIVKTYEGRHDVRGAAICIFTNEWDNDSHQHYTVKEL